MRKSSRDDYVAACKRAFDEAKAFECAGSVCEWTVPETEPSIAGTAGFIPKLRVIGTPHATA
jgi:hypothetical protein